MRERRCKAKAEDTLSPYAAVRGEKRDEITLANNIYIIYELIRKVTSISVLSFC